jgi:hypothetical protein
MLKCRVIKLNLLFKIESHSSSGVVSFLNILNISWFTKRKKEGKTRKKVSLSITSFSATKMILLLLFVYWVKPTAKLIGNLFQLTELAN